MSAFIIILCLINVNLADVSFGGEGKIRFRYITADTADIYGSYGEALKQGMSLRARLDLYLSWPIIDNVTADAGLRISNEGTSPIQPAPDYISGKVSYGWWQVDYSRGALDAVIGTYDASFTPLTLMRWDTRDNPMAASGCACQVSVGGISGESLEEPQEDYQFEGARIKAEASLGDLTVLFARPETPVESLSYLKYAAGGRGRLVLPFFGRSAPVVLGATALRVKDDPSSVSYSPLAPLQSDVIGVDLKVPVIAGFLLAGEGAWSVRDDNIQSDLNDIRRGYGLIAGVQYQRQDRIDGDISVLQLDPWFSPLYKALSYAKNRRGIKGSFVYRDLEIARRPVTVSLYAKDWREIKPTWNETITEWHDALQTFLVATAAVNVGIFGDWHLETDYEYRSAVRDDDPLTGADEAIDNITQIMSLILSYDVTFQTKLTLKAQVIDYADHVADANYRAFMPMIQFSTKF